MNCAALKRRDMHPKADYSGVCRRCGLGMLKNQGRCPPGFWMTAAEAKQWNDASPSMRRVLEVTFASTDPRPAQATAQKGSADK
jgi:hypothetical protein